MVLRVCCNSSTYKTARRRQRGIKKKEVSSRSEIDGGINHKRESRGNDKEKPIYIFFNLKLEQFVVGLKKKTENFSKLPTDINASLH